jgi:hypothetical protein
MSCKPVVSQSCDVKGLTTRFNSTQLVYDWIGRFSVQLANSEHVQNQLSWDEMRWVESCDVNATKNSTQLTSTSCDPVLLPGPIAAHRAVPARRPLGGIIMLVTSSCCSDLVYCTQRRGRRQTYCEVFQRFLQSLFVSSVLITILSNVKPLS